MRAGLLLRLRSLRLRRVALRRWPWRLQLRLLQCPLLLWLRRLPLWFALRQRLPRLKSLPLLLLAAPSQETPAN